MSVSDLKILITGVTWAKHPATSPHSVDYHGDRASDCLFSATNVKYEQTMLQQIFEENN